MWEIISASAVMEPFVRIDQTSEYAIRGRVDGFCAKVRADPVIAHFRLERMKPGLFHHWLELFVETCSEPFVEGLSDAFHVKAVRAAETLKLALFYRTGRAWPRSVS